METYNYNKSHEWFSRATKVIPGGIYGHLGPAEGCFLPVTAYPFYVDRAEGPYIWDVDGNRFIDLMCGYGPIILGYNDPDVEASAKAQGEKVNCAVLPGTIMVELAELFVDTIKSADWAFFAKNGSDVTTLALLTARAATGRDKVIRHPGGYHGVHPWMQGKDYAGITKEDVANNLFTPFGDFGQLEQLVSANPGQIAALISTPYHHPIFEDNVVADPSYWAKVRDLCTKEGIVLIVDDVRCGFRLDTAGSDQHYGFDADLACYCKSIGNGYNISALVGKQDLMDAAGSIFYTGSYWLSAVPMAAAYACVKKLREIDSAKLVLDIGSKLAGGITEVAGENGFDFRISGEPSMPYFRTAGFEDQVDNNFMLHQAWVSECVKRGVFLANHHNLFINTAMSSEDIDFIVSVADEAFRVVKKNVGKILGKGI